MVAIIICKKANLYIFIRLSKLTSISKVILEVYSLKVYDYFSQVTYKQMFMSKVCTFLHTSTFGLKLLTFY
jgi:hypothetical protein